MASALNESGILNGVSQGRDTVGPGKVNVMTRHSSKGLEFFKAVVMGESKDENPATWSNAELRKPAQKDALAKERPLLHVAAARTHDELVLTNSPDS